jgi:hypothetical protein
MVIVWVNVHGKMAMGVLRKSAFYGKVVIGWGFCAQVR